jgi:hypothetical protein
MKKSRLLLIGGCPRSGTGALARLLTNDGRAIVTGEKGLTAWKDIFSEKSDIDKSKIQYVGDKMPQQYLLGAETLYKKFPDSKFIFTVRNGYGVIASYLRRPLKKRDYKTIPHDIVVKNIVFAENVWKEAFIKLKSIHKVLPKDKYLVLKYENNCADIDDMLLKLGNFLEYDTPVVNTMYRPVHLNWEKGLEFWRDIIFSNVSNEFKELMQGYNSL